MACVSALVHTDLPFLYRLLVIVRRWLKGPIRLVEKHERVALHAKHQTRATIVIDILKREGHRREVLSRPQQGGTEVHPLLAWIPAWDLDDLQVRLRFTAMK